LIGGRKERERPERPVGLNRSTQGDGSGGAAQARAADRAGAVGKASAIANYLQLSYHDSLSQFEK
jgi:hypothetical protein